jgi:hypothetical protein
VVIVAVAAGSSSSSKEATFSVWQNGCKNLQSFTRKEVVETWGASAVSGEKLKGAPANIDEECTEREEHKAAEERKAEEPTESGDTEAEEHKSEGEESEGPGSESHAEDAKFCSEHECIGNFDNGHGTVVQCSDGEWSHSGGISGACSDHGGEKEE